MLNVSEALPELAPEVTTSPEGYPLLRPRAQWFSTGGKGIVAGLLDTGIDPQVPDLAGADLIVRDFAPDSPGDPGWREHGTHSATLFLAQGQTRLRGLAPHARLSAARVVSHDGVALPSAVVAALDWLLAAGAEVIAIPLGDPVVDGTIAAKLAEGAARGVLFFAAAGNCYPDPLLFPASDPQVIAVGAADEEGVLLPDCSRYPRLDLVVAGREVPAWVNAATIATRRGSSVACVVAAAVATLALSARAIRRTRADRMSMLALLRGGHAA